MEKYELENGHTVHMDAQYIIEYNNKQYDLPEGTTLTVMDISKTPAGISIEFNVDFPNGITKEDHPGFTGEPVVIMAFALNNLLKDGDMSTVSS